MSTRCFARYMWVLPLLENESTPVKYMGSPVVNSK